MESLLSQIEGETKPVIDKIDNGEEISDTEKEMLSLFAGFLKTRVPDFEKSINQMSAQLMKKVNKVIFSNNESVTALMTRSEAETGEKSELSAEELMAFVQDEQYEIVMHRNFSLGMMVELSAESAKYFRQMDWLLFHAPDKTSFREKKWGQHFTLYSW